MWSGVESAEMVIARRAEGLIGGMALSPRMGKKKSARWIPPRISQRALFSEPLGLALFG